VVDAELPSDTRCIESRYWHWIKPINWLFTLNCYWPLENKWYLVLPRWWPNDIALLMGILVLSSDRWWRWPWPI